MSMQPEMTRREFVKLAGAAAIAPAVLAAARQPASSDTKMLRIGVIGCGGRGTSAAMQAMLADANTKVVALGDVFGDRLDTCHEALKSALGTAGADRLDVPPERRFLGFDCHERVLGAGVDVVILTAYPGFRPMHLKAAVDAGVHVFAEKPLAVDGPGVRSVLESAAEAARRNRSLVVGFCWRYHDGLKAIFERVNSGAIGDILSVQSTYYTNTLTKRPRKPEWSDMEFQVRNWCHFTWVSGDHIVEQAVHSVDRLSWAMGDALPQRVICLGGRAARSGPEHGHVYDHFSAVYEFDNGRRGFLCTRQIDGCPADNSDYIWGTKGVATVNGWAPVLVTRDIEGKETWKYEGPSDRDMYQTEHDEMFAAIRAGKPINDGARAAKTTLMAIMARMAAYTGQTISWEQALNSKESLLPERLEFGPLPTPEVAVPGKTKFI